MFHHYCPILSFSRFDSFVSVSLVSLGFCLLLQASQFLFGSEVVTVPCDVYFDAFSVLVLKEVIPHTLHKALQCPCSCCQDLSTVICIVRWNNLILVNWSHLYELLQFQPFQKQVSNRLGVENFWGQKFLKSDSVCWAFIDGVAFCILRTARWVTP